MAARLLALGTLVFVAAACGAEAVPRGAPTASEHHSVRFEVVVDSPEPEGGLPFRSTGLLDLKRGRSETHGGEDGFHEITVGLVSYEELQPHIAVPPGKRWCRHDGALSETDFLATLQKPGVNSIHFYGGSQPESPAGYLDYLRKVSRVEPKRIGPASVRGVSTLRYSGGVDDRLFWSHSLAAAGWRESSIERYLEFVADGERRVEAWIDANGYARRVVTYEDLWASWHGPPPPNVEPWQMKPTVVTTEYFEFDVDVDIQPPVEAEVIDCAELPVREG